MFFKMDVLGSWLRSAGGMPVNPEGDSAHSMKEMLRAVKSGRILGIFPEGTRSWDGKQLPPMAGIGLLVAASDAPVIPIHVDGAYEAWPRHHRLPRFKRITIRFGKPMMLDDLRAKMTTDRKHRREHQRAIAEAVMDAIAELAPTPPAARVTTN
jgi:1-acyl-sn-glycerol-3-phosphate acyltransferase